MPDLNQFKAFHAKLSVALKAGDESALRATLPPGIPVDHFAFLLQLNQSLATGSVEPVLSCTGEHAVAAYQSESADGSESMTREFWWYEGRWVSYNPTEPS